MPFPITVKFFGNVNADRYVDKEAFPDFLSLATKGFGYHDYEIPYTTFTFADFDGGISQYLQRFVPVEFAWRDTGKILFVGYINEIKKLSFTRHEVTVTAYAQRLTEVNVGSLIDLDTGDEVDDDSIPVDTGDLFIGDPIDKVREFDTGGYTNARLIIQQVLNSFNGINKSETPRIDASSDTIPDPVKLGVGPFFGQVLIEFGSDSALVKLVKLIKAFSPVSPGKPRRFRDNIEVRRAQDPVSGAYLYYILHWDGDFFRKRIIKKNKVFGVWPGRDIFIPMFGMKATVRRLIAGGEELTESTEPYIPYWPFNTSEPNASNYGRKYAGRSAKNVPESRVRGFFSRRQGFVNPEIITSFDLGPANSYFLVEARRVKQLGRSMFLASYETSDDFFYYPTYHNTVASKIIKHVAILANRRLYYDPAGNTVHLVPRVKAVSLDAGVTGTPRVGEDAIVIEEKWIQSIVTDIQPASTSSGDTNVPRYKEDDLGKPTSYGMRLRDAEIKAIEYRVNRVAGRNRIATTVEVGRLDQSAAIGKSVFTKGRASVTQSIGVIIQIDWAIKGRVSKIVTEYYQ